MKPQRMYLVAVFVRLLTSLGFAQSQEDARDAPKRLASFEHVPDGIGGLCDAHTIPMSGSSAERRTCRGAPDPLSNGTD